MRRPLIHLPLCLRRIPKEGHCTADERRPIAAGLKRFNRPQSSARPIICLCWPGRAFVPRRIRCAAGFHAAKAVGCPVVMLHKFSACKPLLPFAYLFFLSKKLSVSPKRPLPPVFSICTANFLLTNPLKVWYNNYRNYIFTTKVFVCPCGQRREEYF